MLLTLLLAMHSWLPLLLFSICLLTVIQIAIPNPRAVWQRLAGFYWFYLLNFLFILFFLDAAFSAGDWQGWRATRWGWAAFYTLRLIDIIALMLLLAHWLQAEQLLLSVISGTQRWRPGRALLQRLLWTLLFAYHFLPLMRRDVQRMRLGVLARGLSFQGALRQRWRVYLSFLVPLLNSLFRRAEALVSVLATRHFNPGSERTMYHIFRLRGRDWTLAGAATLGCGWAIL